MKRTLVGTLDGLWRYPVKSMQGEKLEASYIGKQGLLGDRAYALWDVETKRVASAKNPRKWSSLLDCHATLEQMPQANQPTPAVKITLPDGATVTSDLVDIDARLSDWIDREIQFLSTVPEHPSLDRYWTSIEDPEYRDTLTQLFLPTGTFFDSCQIHAITNATLDRLQELYPQGMFDLRRFRPNLAIDTESAQADFVENAWVGNILALGDSVRLKIDTACPRCVVTTLAQGNLPEDLAILKTAARHNDIFAGIRLSVIEEGSVCMGDSIWLEEVEDGFSTDE